MLAHRGRCGGTGRRDQGDRPQHAGGARLSTQVASNVTDVNKGAGETGSASTQVFASAQSLSKESGQLRLEVDKFLTAMRAA